MGKKLREIEKFSLGRGGGCALKLSVIPAVLIMLLIFAVLKKISKSSESEELSSGDSEEGNVASDNDNKRVIQRNREKTPQQCRGVTASGRRCRRMVYNGEGFCAQHSDQAKT